MRKRVAIFCPCLCWQGEAAVWETKSCTFVCRKLWMLISAVCCPFKAFHIFSYIFYIFSEFSSLSVCSLYFISSVNAILDDLHQCRSLTGDIYWVLMALRICAQKQIGSPKHKRISWFNVVYSNSNCHSSFSSAWGPDLATERLIVDDNLKWARQDVFPLSPEQI